MADVSSVSPLPQDEALIEALLLEVWGESPMGMALVDGFDVQLTKMLRKFAAQLRPVVPRTEAEINEPYGRRCYVLGYKAGVADTLSETQS